MDSWLFSAACTAKVFAMRFANCAYLATTTAIIAMMYPMRYVPLVSPVDGPSDLSLVPPEDYGKYEQHSPLWYYIRGMPAATGSAIAALLGFHDQKVAIRLRLPATMHRGPGPNPNWVEYNGKLQHGFVPPPPFGVPASVFASWGTYHEPNAELGLLAFLPPEARLHECGTEQITPTNMQWGGVVDVFTGEPMHSHPMTLRDSPDGLVTIRDPDTGAERRIAVELKCGTMVFPCKGAEMEMYEYTLGNTSNSYPYPMIKPYYLTQVFMHMLALKASSAYFLSLAPSGCKIWEVAYSQRYVSLMLSLLKYLYENYTAKGIDVPTGVAELCPDERFRKFHAELVDMTEHIVRSTSPLISFDRPYTLALTHYAADRRHTDQTVEFPSIPLSIPPFMRLVLFANTLGFHEGVRATHDYEDLVWREANIACLTENPDYAFTRPVLRCIAEGHEFSAAVAALDPTKSKIMEIYFMATSRFPGSTWRCCIASTTSPSASCGTSGKHGTDRVSSPAISKACSALRCRQSARTGITPCATWPMFWRKWPLRHRNRTGAATRSIPTFPFCSTCLAIR